MQADLAAVGIRTRIDTFEWGTYLSRYNAGLGKEADLGAMSFMLDPGDPAPMLSLTVNSAMAFPYVLLAIALVAALGPGLFNAMVAIAVVNISFYARGVRSAVLILREQHFIEASRSLGATHVRVITRHILPNIVPALLVFVSMHIGWMITETAGLSFIGLGAQPPTADWGTMLADGRQFITVAAHVATLPGLAILGLVLGLNLLGDCLRDALEPRLRA
jgi:peptide/nickel transport system permease protein